jgi:ketosteroid isomerase-like protein
MSMRDADAADVCLRDVAHPGAGTQVAGHTRCLTIWKKQADGSWKAAVDIGNSGPPVAS